MYPLEKPFTVLLVMQILGTGQEEWSMKFILGILEFLGFVIYGFFRAFSKRHF